MSRSNFIIAIDGPAGAGKSSASKSLAGKLGYLTLDSGSLYRAMAWRMIQDKVDTNRSLDVEAACAKLRIKLCLKGASTEVWVDEVNVTPYLRLPEVTELSSTISAFPGIRHQLLSVQRSIGNQGGVVIEGRDIGTVVFPEAEVKFYLDASVRVRALRRYHDLRIKGVETDIEATIQNIKDRDEKDRQRKIAPLRQGQDAIVIDSTRLKLDEVIDRMYRVVMEVIAQGEKMKTPSAEDPPSCQEK